ncbi:MAG: peptidylprolyl isomerase [Myxococcota bacterium]
MLEVLRRSQRWIMWIVIIGVGLVFTVFVGAGSPTLSAGPPVVVGVDEFRFDPRDVNRVRRIQEDEYRRVLGDAYDSDAASAQLDSLAANILVSQALRAREAEGLGLAVSDEEIRDHVKRVYPGAIDENGRLRSEDIVYFAESEFGSERRFVELLRMDLLARKLQRLFLESLAVSDQEAREALLHRQEEVSLAYVSLDLKSPGGDATVSEEEVEALVREDESRVRDLYEERIEDYERAESVRVRHILFQVDEDAGEEEVAGARERAEAARARIQEGAAFVEVALEVSEDEGTQAAGGDLGFVERGGQLSPALEAVAFDLQAGEESELVRTSAGFHLLRVEERREPGAVPFSDVRSKLARELLGDERAREQAQSQANALAAAVDGGESLVDASRSAGLSLERPDPLRRRPDSYIPGLGAAPEVMTAAFTLSEPQPSSSQVFEVGDRLVLIQLLERSAPSEAELEAEIPAERERLESLRVGQLTQSWLDERRNELVESGKLVYDLTLLQ